MCGLSQEEDFSQLLTLSIYLHTDPQKHTCIYDGANNLTQFMYVEEIPDFCWVFFRMSFNITVKWHFHKD